MNPLDPTTWCREALGLKIITDDQQAMFQAILDHKYIHVRGGNGLSKTHGLAAFILWWGHNFEPCAVVTTAAVGRQVKGTLWYEIRRQFANAPWNLRGAMADKAAHWQIGKESYAVGYTTRAEKGKGDQDVSSRFGGIHHENLLMILDEASGIDKAIFTAAEGCIPARMVVSGNPLAKQGEFWEIKRRADEAK